ncbi:O-antigen ligase family protein [Pseudoalteromonas mariniglutinosa]|uniref:O-antigen ligase family protein n=1 Tax=Pseudoalteromonas mariniglutinosa TaxID=206042 RepID=UPI003850A52E
MKWLLLIVTSIALIELYYKHGLVNTLKPFYHLFIALLVSQLASIILNQGKDTESLSSTSNAVSYIAGYAHESAFSILLYTGFLISSILLLKKNVKAIVPFLFIVGLVFANYRTMLIASLIPLLFTYIAYLYMGTKKDTKLIMICFTVIAVIGFNALFAESVVERFGELGGAISSFSELMTIDYSLFTDEERRLLSTRLYLWNMYLTEFSYFSFSQMLLGAGPEVWSDHFEVYAHNTFVAVLYDLGIIGLLALLAMLYTTLLLTLKITDKKLRVVAIGLFIGFFVMSNSTMPLWAVEGIHLYSFIFTIAFYLSKRKISEQKQY